MRRGLYIAICLLMLPLLSARAQEKETAETPLCPLFAAMEFEVGGLSMIDTYLSPRVYQGWNIALGGEWMRVMKTEQYRWVWQQQLHLNYGRGRMPASGNGLTDAGVIHYAFAMMRQSQLPIEGLRLYYGGMAGVTAGGLYNYHGGNNPVSVKADISIGLTGMAVYSFRIGKLPITARYQASLPVVGVFAQPEYAESYYEVGLGNHKNFIHVGTWGNKFDMENRVTIDLHFGSLSMRVGYHNVIYTTYEAGNRYQMVTNNFIIGFAGDLLRYDKHNENRTVKRALYTY